MDSRTSIYTAELTAIVQAIHLSENTDKKIKIFTDSLSAVKAIKNDDNSEYGAIYVREKIYEQNGKIKLIWVPGHVGIKGNTLADLAAKEAAKDPIIEIEAQLYCQAESFIKNQYVLFRQNKWDNESSFLKLHEPVRSQIIGITGVERKAGITFTRIKLGTAKILQQLFSRQIPLKCQFCNMKVSFRHIFYECPRNSNLHISNSLKCSNPQQRAIIKDLLKTYGLREQI